MQEVGGTAPSITTRQAARQAGITLHGLRAWFRRYPGLGHKVAGRWRVDPSVLSDILKGVPPGNGGVGHEWNERGASGT